MILVDTSIWIDHLRSGNQHLSVLLDRAEVCMHPFIRGELACGNLQQRTTILALMRNLLSARVATDDEVLFMIERHALMGQGLGYIDMHLLAAVRLSDGVRLWTRDMRLNAAAQRLGYGYH